MNKEEFISKVANICVACLVIGAVIGYLLGRFLP
jgi:F0F1-type ATP synthase assembly protein I